MLFHVHATIDLHGIDRTTDDEPLGKLELGKCAPTEAVGPTMQTTPEAAGSLTVKVASTGLADTRHVPP